MEEACLPALAGEHAVRDPIVLAASTRVPPCPRSRTALGRTVLVNEVKTQLLIAAAAQPRAADRA